MDLLIESYFWESFNAATIGSSNDYLIRRLNLRRKIVDERVKETQDILQRQFSMEYASSLNTY